MENRKCVFNCRAIVTTATFFSPKRSNVEPVSKFCKKAKNVRIRPCIATRAEQDWRMIIFNVGSIFEA